MRTLVIPIAVSLLAAAGGVLGQEIDLGAYVTDTLDEQTVRIKPLGGEATTVARIFGSPGEYEPLSFAVRPTERVEQMMIRSTALVGPGEIAAENVSVASIEGYHGGDRDMLMELGRPWNMPAYQRELFWATVHIPEGAPPGLYTGAVEITSRDEKIGQIDVELEVLPIRFAAIPYALGHNYSSPKDPDALAAHLADMREHGMTTVAPLYNFHLPIYDDDTTELGEFIEAYKSAGYDKPLFFASPMSLSLNGLTGYGPIDSKRFQRKYISVIQKLHAEVELHDVPVIFSIGDEFTNKGVAGVEYAEQLARLTYEELPEIATTSDMNGYREVMAMAPYLDVATFDNGWDGVDHHNEGRRLVNKEFILEVQQTGAIPWFVNTGSGRLPYGLFFWKMAKYGVQGKVEWYYNLGDNEPGSVVRTDGATVWPTVIYERSREGIDDLRYLVTLEKAIEDTKRAGEKAAEVAAAEALLAVIGDSILDNWTAYSSGGELFSADGFDTVPDGQVESLWSFQAVRRAVADAIVALQG